MARDHARLLLSIWSDHTWTDLTSTQQQVYIALISSPDLSYCGVVPYIPARYTRISSDMTERKFTQAVHALAASKYVIIDPRTAELLVRSYVRHDGLLKQPNVTKAMVTAMRKVHSPTLREAIEDELVRLLTEQPDVPGWRGFQDVDPEGFKILLAKG